jgi:hypothetical protein
MKKNLIKVRLRLSEQGLAKFKLVPTFKNKLHPNQLETLQVGENFLVVNHTTWGDLQRLVGYDPLNMSLSKTSI